METPRPPTSRGRFSASTRKRSSYSRRPRSPLTRSDVQIAAAREDVHIYTAGRSDAERRAVANAFADGNGRRFLICDRTGEEGLNLQVADCIVHVDLPLSTTRIEQRIGRVDRHGEHEPVTNYVVEPGPDGGFGAWWLEALTNSFEVFDRTTAPLQYAIETVQGELLKTLALEGVDEAGAALAIGQGAAWTKNRLGSTSWTVSMRSRARKRTTSSSSNASARWKRRPPTSSRRLSSKRWTLDAAGPPRHEVDDREARRPHDSPLRESARRCGCTRAFPIENFRPPAD